MNQPAVQVPKRTHAQSIRPIVFRSRGNRHGPINRLVSPGDLGELLKPFVFLDQVNLEDISGFGFRPHPHSGIATLTNFIDGRMSYADSTGQSGVLTAGSVEWMRAGRGVWHGGNVLQGPMRGYQLWIALPPSQELAEPESLYLPSDRIEHAGPARVLLGHYGGKSSPVPYSEPLTYLHVRLHDGERWTYQPGDDHDIAWLALNAGQLQMGGEILHDEIAVFEEGAESIELVGKGNVELVVGSARKHPYPLVTGHYSVHTDASALKTGERTISALSQTPAVRSLGAAVHAVSHQ